MCWISVLPVRLHWGASVEDSKGAFHEFRHTVLVEEKSLKHEDTDHLNPSLWKPSMPVKPHSDGGGEDQGSSSQQRRSQADLTGTLPSSQSGGSLEWRAVTAVFVFSEVVWWRGWDWEQRHVNSEDLGCRKLHVVECILCCDLFMLKPKHVKRHQIYENVPHQRCGGHRIQMAVIISS